MQGGETPPSFIAMKRVSAQIRGMPWLHGFGEYCWTGTDCWQSGKIKSRDRSEADRGQERTERQAEKKRAGTL